MSALNSRKERMARRMEIHSKGSRRLQMPHSRWGRLLRDPLEDADPLPLPPPERRSRLSLLAPPLPPGEAAGVAPSSTVEAVEGRCRVEVTEYAGEGLVDKEGRGEKEEEEEEEEEEEKGLGGDAAVTVPLTSLPTLNERILLLQAYTTICSRAQITTTRKRSREATENDVPTIASSAV